MVRLNENLWNQLLDEIDDIEAVYERAFEWIANITESEVLISYRPDPLEDISTNSVEMARASVLRGDVTEPDPIEIETIQTNESGMVELSHELIHLRIDEKWFGAIESDQPLEEDAHEKLVPITQFLQFTARYHFHRDRAGISEWFLKISRYLSEDRGFEKLSEALLGLACEAIDHDTSAFYTIEEHQLQLVKTRGFDIDEHRGRRTIDLENLVEEGLDSRNLIYRHTENGQMSLYIPLRMGSELIGLIVFYDLETEEQRITQAKEFSLTALATISAIALNNLELSSQLQEKVIHDELSGLKTNEYFQERVHQEIERGQRFQTPSSLLLIDLDHFDQINDQYGDTVGNAVLRELGRVIRNSVRRIDICSRVEDDDQFGILFPNTNLKQALKASERLQEVLNTPLMDIRGEEIEIDFSGGLASFPEDAEDVEELFRQVELALYEAKQTGKNRIVTTQDVEDSTDSDGS